VTAEVRRALASVWTDREAASLYRYRAPYPPVLFEALRRFVVPPPVVLDAGCGTGALSRHLGAFASRIDAIDPSAAMIEEGRRLSGGDDPRIDDAPDMLALEGIDLRRLRKPREVQPGETDVEADGRG